MNWRFSTLADVPMLAEWNYRLIRDEGHRNTMTVEQLAERMAGWLMREYKAVIFFAGNSPVAYVLYRIDPDLIYLRQLFVPFELRRQGYGRAAFDILREQIWPKEVRLTVEVLTRNTAAIAFWKSVGYQDYSLTLEIMPPDGRA